jgi:four helix bundle protein
MGTYKDLKVWQKSMLLARRIYEITRRYPVDEKFGLISQMRRCAVSIPSNIAEGYAREGEKEQAHFLFISLGSSNELETQIILSHEFHYVSEEENSEIMDLNSEVNKMLSSLIYTLRHPKPQELKNS